MVTSMGIHHAKTHTLRGKVFDETRAEWCHSWDLQQLVPFKASQPSNHLTYFSDMTSGREMTSPPGFLTLNPIPGPNANELPPIHVSTFTAITPENMPFTNHTSTSANSDPMISLAFVEANYEVLESLLRERRRHMCNKDLHTKLEYFSEEYDKEREMEPRPVRVRETTPICHTESSRVQRQKKRVVEFEDAPNRDGIRVERKSEGGRPLERRAEDSKHQGMNLPHSWAVTPPLGEPLPITLMGDMPRRPLRAIIFLHLMDYTGCLTPFVCWIEDYPLPDRLKMPSHVGSYDEKGDPDNYLHLFEDILGLHEEQRISGFVHGLKIRSLVEFLSTDLLTTYNGLMEKTYTWIEAKKVATNGASNDHRESFDRFIKNSSWDNNKGKKNRDMFSPYLESNQGLLSNLSKSPRELLATEKATKTFEQPPRMIGSRWSHDMSKYCYFHKDHRHDTSQCRELRRQVKEAMKLRQLSHLVKGITKGKAKVLDTQLGDWKKGDKYMVKAEAHILMINREGHTPKRKTAEGPISGIGEITFPPISGVNNSSDLVIIKPSIRALRVGSKVLIVSFSESTLGISKRTAMQKMGIVVSMIHEAIKFHTPRGIDTIFSAYAPDKIEEGQKKFKEARLEIMKGFLSYVEAEERIVVSDKYPDQTIVIKKQLPTSFKKKLQDLLRSNINVFAWIYADMMGIPRTIMVGGKPFNTEHKLNEYKHITPIKQKKHGLSPDRSEVACKEVEELMKAGILRRVKNQTCVANLVMVKISDRGATYQRLVDKVFSDQIRRNLKAYVDNMVIKSTSEEDMLKDIQETFNRFWSVNMELNPKKCSFGVEEGSFLGHLITKQGIRANPSKVKVVTNLEPPKTLKDVQSLNGKLAALSRFLLPRSHFLSSKHLKVIHTRKLYNGQQMPKKLFEK
ncbi:hypothetical protein Tco_0762875 [Tanacetum coccineum]